MRAAELKPDVPVVWMLVSLEAALGGCNVVATLNGGMQSYLGGDAWYCDPDSPASIESAIAGAWAAPLRPEIGPDLAACFTWERAALETESHLATAS